MKSFGTVHGSRAFRATLGLLFVIKGGLQENFWNIKMDQLTNNFIMLVPKFKLFV
jgi:hypothetical protein